MLSQEHENSVGASKKINEFIPRPVPTGSLDFLALYYAVLRGISVINKVLAWTFFSRRE